MELFEYVRKNRNKFAEASNQTKGRLLRNQYHSLAKKYHPDMATGDRYKFMSINETYKLLKRHGKLHKFVNLTTDERNLFYKEWKKRYDLIPKKKFGSQKYQWINYAKINNFTSATFNNVKNMLGHQSKRWWNTHVNSVNIMTCGYIFTATVGPFIYFGVLDLYQRKRGYRGW